jgi:hypothetical protein
MVIVNALQIQEEAWFLGDLVPLVVLKGMLRSCVLPVFAHTHTHFML